MLIHLIRHAHAGSRSRWEAPDWKRPLSSRGEGQARAIADQLEGGGIDVLWSSRFVRCAQTLDPLAARLGLAVTVNELFSEGGDGEPALDALLAAAAAGHTVAASSHGDVIPAVVAAALGRGASLHGSPSPAKGARYELRVQDGRVRAIRHVAAPVGAA